MSNTTIQKSNKIFCHTCPRAKVSCKNKKGNRNQTEILNILDEYVCNGHWFRDSEEYSHYGRQEHEEINRGSRNQEKNKKKNHQ
jgi:hypothetical protein